MVILRLNYLLKTTASFNSEPALPGGKSCSYDALNELINSGNVLASPVNREVKNVSFQYQNENNNTITIDGIARGIAILREYF